MMIFPPQVYANVLASVRMQVPAPIFLHEAHSDDKAKRNDGYRKPETVVDVAGRNHKTKRHGWHHSSNPTHPQVVRNGQSGVANSSGKHLDRPSVVLGVGVG